MAYRWNSEVRILDLASLQMIKSIDNGNDSVCINFSPNGNFLLVGNFKDWIKVLDLTCDSSVALKVNIKGRTQSTEYVDKYANYQKVCEPKWSPCGNFFMFRWNKQLKVYSWDGQKEAEAFCLDHKDDLEDICFSPDG